jgi:hypothetical protein
MRQDPSRPKPFAAGGRGQRYQYRQGPQDGTRDARHVTAEIADRITAAKALFLSIGAIWSRLSWA